jgi:homoserine dehydrogenase
VTHQTAARPLNVALLGCGVVGSEVARLLRDQAADLAARIGAPVEMNGIAVRRPQRGSTARCSPPTPPGWCPGRTPTS